MIEKSVCLVIFFAIAIGNPIPGRSVIGAPVVPRNAKGAAESYAKYCASCHGKDGRAKTFKAKLNHARNLADAEWQGRISDERIFNSIMNGKGKMPAYGKKLSEQEIDGLVAYVRALKK
jgi:mono/diheme cytochrome c family protein